MKSKLVLTLIVLIVIASLAMAITLPRNETLYLGGAMWGPLTNFNPLNPSRGWGVGYVYQTLFIYNPLTNKLIPWMAKDGKWINATTYEVVLRKGMTWTDGQPVTAKDVKYTFELPFKVKQLVPLPGLETVKVINNRTVEFVLNPQTVNYPEFYSAMYSSYIIPQHIWSKIPANKVFSVSNLKNPIGDGPYKLLTYNQSEIILERNDNWWGNNIFGKPTPKYVVEIRVSSNNVALGLLLQGKLDISNFYLPGAQSLIKPYHLAAWHNTPPYMLPYATVLLFLNTTKAPLNNAQFRRALAYAIGPTNELTQRVYSGQVLSYVNPVGFLPIKSWMQFYNKSVEKQYGYVYDPKKAEQILNELGYKKGTNGWRTLPNGKPLKLAIICPYGWTDWMAAERIVAQDLRKIGLNVTAEFPDYPTYWNNFTSGNYTMALNSFGAYVSMTPYTYLYWLFGYPVQKYMYNGNFERYSNSEITKLIDKIATYKLDNVKALTPLYSKLEKIFLQEMPVIPLWYNGQWYLANQSVWTNYPTAKNPYVWPSTWAGGGSQVGSLLLYPKLKHAH